MIQFSIITVCLNAGQGLLDTVARTLSQTYENFEIIVKDGGSEDGSLEKSPDRRAWERVSQIISTLKSEEINDTHKKVIAGIVGTKATSKFFESLKASIMLSAIDILTKDFELSKRLLSKYITPQFAVLNNNLFRTLETASFSEKQKDLAAQNLQAYFARL